MKFHLTRTTTPRKLLLMFVVVFTYPNPGLAAPYVFIQISDSGDAGANSLNNSGIVAYEDGGFVIASDGVATTVITTDFSGSGIPWINDNGSIAFSQLLPGDTGVPFFNNNKGIFVADGTTTSSVADTVIGPYTNFGGGPSLNNLGQVAFQARVSDRPEIEGVFRVDEGNTRTNIAVDTDTDPTSPFLSFGSRVPINNLGQVAFLAEDVGPSLVSINRGDGTTTTTITNTLGEFDRFGSPGSINDLGEVAFGALMDNGDIGIYVGDGDSLHEIVRTDGQNQATRLSHPGINNLGDVAFGLFHWTFPDDAASGFFPDSGGIYLGSDFDNDVVIEIGDELFGHTVGRLDFFGFLNDSRQLSFRAHFEDGSKGVYRADPVPEPGTLVLLAAGGVAFLTCHRRHVTHTQ